MSVDSQGQQDNGQVHDADDPPGPGSGSPDQSETRALNAVQHETTAPFPSQGGELRPIDELFQKFPEHAPNPNVTVTPEQRVPWGPEQGLQSSNAAPFQDVPNGVPPDDESRLLWTAANGDINIAPELVQTSREGEPPTVALSKHTNLSPQASVAGEAWIAVDESWHDRHDVKTEQPGAQNMTVYFDTNSGRFGHSVDSDDFDPEVATAQVELVTQAMADLGYNVQPALPGLAITPSGDVAEPPLIDVRWPDEIDLSGHAPPPSP